MSYSSDSSDYNNYYISDESDENESILVIGKNQMDGAETIEQMIEKLNTFMEYLVYLKEDGWQLRSPVENDVACLYK